MTLGRKMSFKVQEPRDKARSKCCGNRDIIGLRETITTLRIIIESPRVALFQRPSDIFQWTNRLRKRKKAVNKREEEKEEEIREGRGQAKDIERRGKRIEGKRGEDKEEGKRGKGRREKRQNKGRKK